MSAARRVADVVVYVALAPLWVPVRIWIAWITWRAKRQQEEDEWR